MNENDILRRKCKELKAFQGISYNELAIYLEIKPSSFYSWLNNQYNLGVEKIQRLYEIVNTLKE